MTKVVLDTALLRETTNGLRIKTYQVKKKKIASIFTQKLFISLCTLWNNREVQVTFKMFDSQT